MREFLVHENDDGTWIAEARELPGFQAKAKTQEEALQEIQAVLKIYYPCRCED